MRTKRAARSRMSSRVHRCNSKPKQTLPCTERQGSSEASWNTMARSGPGPVTSLPSTRIEPRARGISPARASNSVLLPQPLDPTMVTKELFSIERVMPWIAAKVSSLFGFLYSIATSRISIWFMLSIPRPPSMLVYVAETPPLFRLPLVDRGHEPVVPVFFLSPRRIDVAGRDGHVEEFAHPVIGGEPAVLAPAIDQQVIGAHGVFLLQPGARDQRLHRARLVGFRKRHRFDEGPQDRFHSLRIGVEIFLHGIERLDRKIRHEVALPGHQIVAAVLGNEIVR